MRFLHLLLLLALFLPRATGAGREVAAAQPVNTLQLAPYPQRLSDRYTTASGLPGKRVTFIRVEGRGGPVRAQTEAGPAVFSAGSWKKDSGGAPVEPLLPPVDRSRLPRGAQLLGAARAADGRV